MNNIFENASNPIFCDMTFLEDDYVPLQLIGRDNEIKKIFAACEPILINGQPRNLLLYGKPGTGKNATNAYVIKMLKDKIKKQKLDIEVQYFKVSCELERTSTAVMRELIEQAEPGRCLAKRGISFRDHFKYFANLFSNDSQRLIIIELNEIDSLKNDDLLYAFSRKSEINAFHKNTKTMIVGTSNDVNCNKLITPRASSSMNPLLVPFNVYSRDQLIDILNGRRAAFHDGVVSDEVIYACSNLSAKEHGDARRAINLLTDAGHFANSNNDSEITSVDVLCVYGEKGFNLVSVINELPDHEKAVLLAVVKLKIPLYKSGAPLKSDKVYPTYFGICSKHGLFSLNEQRVLDLLTSLESNHLISIKNTAGGKNRYLIELNERINNQLFDIESYLDNTLNDH